MTHLIETYAQWPLTLVRGAGSLVWDSEGREYLDYYGGHAVALMGHCHPAVAAAVKAQSETLMFYSNLVDTVKAGELATALAKTLEPKTYLSYFCNHGAEANETALKIARKGTGRTRVLAFHGGFHGRSSMALAATGMPSYHTVKPDFVEYTDFVDFGDLAAVEKTLSDAHAAVITEPIQSIGGMNEADAAFFRGLADLCNRRGAMLIFDEVQTGGGRVGTWWYADHVGVFPHLITTAKGLAGGLPIGVVLARKDAADTIRMNDIATTFGGGPVIMAAALASMQAIEKDGLLENARKMGDYLKENMLKLPGVTGVRGMGCLLGAALSKPAADVVPAMRFKGVLVGGSGKPDTLRLFPPVTTNTAEADRFLTALAECLQ